MIRPFKSIQTKLRLQVWFLRFWLFCGFWGFHFKIFIKIDAWQLFLYTAKLAKSDFTSIGSLNLWLFLLSLLGPIPVHAKWGLGYSCLKGASDLETTSSLTAEVCQKYETRNILRITNVKNSSVLYCISHNEQLYFWFLPACSQGCILLLCRPFGGFWPLFSLVVCFLQKLGENV